MIPTTLYIFVRVSKPVSHIFVVVAVIVTTMAFAFDCVLCNSQYL